MMSFTTLIQNWSYRPIYLSNKFSRASSPTYDIRVEGYLFASSFILSTSSTPY